MIYLLIVREPRYNRHFERVILYPRGLSIERLTVALDPNKTGAHAALTPKQIKKAQKEAEKKQAKALKEQKKAQKNAKKEGIPVDVAVNATARFSDAQPSSGHFVTKPKRSKKRIAGIVFGSIFGVLALVYLAGCVWFWGHFFPNSVFGSHDVSWESSEEFAKELDGRIADYRLEVSSEVCDYQLTITGDQIDVKIDKDAVRKDACSTQNFLAWPYEIFQKHDVSNVVRASFNEEVLNTILDASIAEYNPTAEPSADATITYNDDFKTFFLTPQVYGKQIDADSFKKSIKESIRVVSSSYEVTNDDFIKPVITADDPRLQKALETANGYIEGEIPLTMNGTVDAGTVDKKTIASWIVLDENLEASLSNELLAQWVDTLSQDMNTAGATKTWVRADGKECTVSGGVYGWKVDTSGLEETILNQITTKNYATIDIPCSQTADRYTPAGGRDFGSYVDVDITEQRVRYYSESDELIYECNCVTGLPTAGRATPKGSYYLRLKQSPATLVSSTKDEEGKPTYETKVSYWMPFIGNSVGLHDATWQSSFGGNRYLTNGSHGCVNLSYNDAKWFYENLPVNTCVITHG